MSSSRTSSGHNSLRTRLLAVTLATSACGPVVVGDRRAKEEASGGNVAAGGTPSSYSEGTGGRAVNPPERPCELRIPGQPLVWTEPHLSEHVTHRAADLNNDRRLDWIVADRRKIRAIFQDTRGYFGAPIETALDLPLLTDIQATRINSDGLPDLVVSSSDPNVFMVLIGDGLGGFTVHTTYEPAAEALRVKPADLNQDSLTDLIIVGERTFQAFWGNGDGSFREGEVWQTALAAPSVVVGDWNADGRPDLALGSSRGGVEIFLALGNEDFEASAQFDSGPVFLETFGDFDDDGVLDLAMSDNGDSQSVTRVGVALGNGDGTFKASVWEDSPPPRKLPIDTNRDGLLDSWLTPPLLLNDGYPISLADWNGDDALDLAIASDESAYIAWGKGISAGASAERVTNIPARLERFAVADLNGNSLPDLVIPTTNNTIIVRDGAGDGTFDPGVEYEVGAEPRMVEALDLNGDSQLDLVTVTGTASSPTLTTLVTQPEGGYRRIEHGLDSDPLRFISGDLDGNGTVDLGLILFGDHEEVRFQILLGSGDGTFFSPVEAAPLQATQHFGFFDVDGDGTLDLHTSGPSGLFVHLGHGDGTLDAPEQVSDVHVVWAGDLNGDRLLDALIVSETVSGPSDSRTPGTSKIDLAIGLRQGFFASTAPLISVNGYPSVRSFDLDRDGHQDLIINEFVLLGDSQLAFSCRATRSFRNAEFADLDANGLTDVIRLGLPQDPNVLSVYMGR